MSRRPQPTLADYIVIALSPALIMLLVGSLVFFLIEVFYQGAYDSRLSFIMAMFVMAAVLIARISIEQGREYSMLFAIPLAAVTAIATIRFVQFSGPLESFSTLINLGLIGLIWWCADRLTWDSTVIDESKDASGEGLLQTAGLDEDATTQNTGEESSAATEQSRRTLWQRFLAHRHRTHSPGVWIIYFSVAALPIFGFGNWFIPGEDLETKRYVFKLLVVYVGSALGLLLTTSFLNLRRYLRQRRLEMPLEMAGTWIGTGAAMILALLLICTLLPRRNPEYSITQLPIFAGSPTDLWTTEYAVGNEGQEDPEKADRTGEQEPEPDSQGGANGQPQSGQPSDQPNQSGQSDQSGPSNQSDPSDKGSGEQQPKGRGETAGQKPVGTEKQQNSSQSESQSQEPGNPSQQSDDKTDKGKSGTKTSGKDKQAKSKSNQRQQSQQEDQNSQQRRDAQQPQSKEDQGKQSRADEQQAPQKKSQQQQPQTQRQKDKQQQPEKKSGRPPGPQPTSKFDPSKIATAIGGTIGKLLKLLYWVIALAIVGYFIWKYWRQIREALVNFLKSLREFWDSLFGRKAVAGADATPAAETAPPPIAFAAYHDPFLTGMSESKPPVEVIRYSFEALEAWAREHGCARGPEQTPQEFVQLVGAHQVAVARDAATLAEMYNRCAYARDSGQRINIEPLRRLWQQMRESIAA